MREHLFYPSVTRTSPLADSAWSFERLARSEWAMGDYVLCEAEPHGYDSLELASGRMVSVGLGDRFIGALGDREATLEATGSWRYVGEDLWMEVLTSAGLVGRLESKSPFLPDLMRGKYLGHVMLGGEKATMARFVAPVDAEPFSIPTILMLGSSMSAGKTTAGQAVVRSLKRQGRRVLAAKLSGAGRYRDILHMQDAGADVIYDFVDAGLPSTVCPEPAYRAALADLLALMASSRAEVAVVEIGASPLAAYNGVVALEAMAKATRFTVLAASDVFAVYGFQQLLNVVPDLVVGPAANTAAGVRLVREHTGLTAVNLSDDACRPVLDQLLAQALDEAA